MNFEPKHGPRLDFADTRQSMEGISVRCPLLVEPIQTLLSLLHLFSIPFLETFQIQFYHDKLEDTQPRFLLDLQLKLMLHFQHYFVVGVGGIALVQPGIV